LNPLKLLFVVTSSALNRNMNTGLENLAWGLAESGHDVHVLSGGYDAVNHEFKLPSSVHYTFTGGDAYNPVHFVEPFMDIMKRRPPDIVVGWMFNLALLSRFTTGTTRPRFIANEGRMPPRSLALSFLRRVALRKMTLMQATDLFRTTFRFCKTCDAVVSISNAVHDALIARYPIDAAKCSVVHRGVDIDSFSFDPKYKTGCPVSLLFAGNIKPGKGVDDLVGSLDFIPSPVQITLCGRAEPGYMKSLMDRVDDAKGGAMIVHKGVLGREELVSHYHSSDFFVFPSHREGLGKALIEAMSCGCPVVCSDIPAFRDVVENGWNGAMVRVKDPESLGRTLAGLIENPDQRLKHITNARKTVESKFDGRGEVSAWLRLLNNFFTASPAGQ
jgi:glycosyltransferase involved in cell wall biosynthesis